MAEPTKLQLESCVEEGSSCSPLENRCCQGQEKIATQVGLALWEFFVVMIVSYRIDFGPFLTQNLEIANCMAMVGSCPIGESTSFFARSSDQESRD